jgi:hypothetical protein
VVLTNYNVAGHSWSEFEHQGMFVFHCTIVLRCGGLVIITTSEELYNHTDRSGFRKAIDSHHEVKL